MKFFAFDLSLEMLRSLQAVLKLLAVRTPNLRKHLEEAVSSVSLSTTALIQLKVTSSLIR